MPELYRLYYSMEKYITKTLWQYRARIIIEQWRKNANHYRSNVIFMALGNDFAYLIPEECDAQFRNYEYLINHINKNDYYSTEVHFGTLQDYFKELHKEVPWPNFPVLSGDFFTYADYHVSYWSGYYTTRPFYKNMERVLMTYVRAAETITTQAITSKAITHLLWVQLQHRLEKARRILALFQHHDAITGTSKIFVVKDYAVKLVKAIKLCQLTIQRAGFYLLREPFVLDQKQAEIHFVVDDLWWSHDELPTRIIIVLDYQTPLRNIVLYNALNFRRQEVFTVLVSTPLVEVFDSKGEQILAQLSPMVVVNEGMSFAHEKFQLSFQVNIEPLALTTYTVSLLNKNTPDEYTLFSKVSIYNAHNLTVALPKTFQVEEYDNFNSQNIRVKCSEKSTELIVGSDGLISAIVADNGTVTRIQLRFVRYGATVGKGFSSGAYVFHPDGPVEFIELPRFPTIVVTEGLLKATVYTVLNVPRTVQITLAVSLYNNPSLHQAEVEIRNTILIEPDQDNCEIALRFSTEIENEDTFYTDENGMQMIKRRYFDKLPIQANFYPMSASAYIEDENTRMTILTSTPLGVASLRPGQIEIMQDRRLKSDDSRGLGEGVLDNVRTTHTFKVIVEEANSPCSHNTSKGRLYGQLTLGAHVSQQILLQPLVSMQYPPSEDSDRTWFNSTFPNTAHQLLVSFRAGISAKSNDGKILRGIGMTFHWVSLDVCYGHEEIYQWYPELDGQIRISEMLGVPPDDVYESSLTFVELLQPLPGGVLTLRPMEVRSVFINDTQYYR